MYEIPFEKHWKWTKTKARKQVNLLQIIHDVIEDFQITRPIPNLKRDASFNVVVQNVFDVEDMDVANQSDTVAP